MGAVALDDTHIYVALAVENGAVIKVPIDGGAPITLASEQPSPAGIVAGNGTVYWIAMGTFGDDLSTSNSDGAVMTVSRDGGLPRALASGITFHRGEFWEQFPPAIALDGTNVYWTDFGTNAADGSIVKVSIDGNVQTVLASDQVAATGIAVDGTGVYWTAQTTHGRALMRAPVDGGSVRELAIADGRAGMGVAIHGSDVFWATSRSLLRVPTTGGVPTVLVVTKPWSIAVDDTNVYWMDFGARNTPLFLNADDGTISGVPLNGGATTSMAAGITFRTTSNIALDKENVYFSDDATNAVMKVRKEGGPTTPVVTMTAPSPVQ